MNAVSQGWMGGLRTRKAKVAGSIPAGGSEVGETVYFVGKESRFTTQLQIYLLQLNS